MEVVERVLPLIKESIKEGYRLGPWRLTDAGDIVFGIMHNPPFMNDEGKALTLYTSLRSDSSEKEVKYSVEHMMKFVDEEKEKYR